MAARELGASAVDSYTVPEWAERNSQLFKTPPPGFDPSTVKRTTAAEKKALAETLLNHLLDAGVGGAEVTNCAAPNIDCPTAVFPASYWRDVENHGNILVSFISTARHKVGFLPELHGTGFTKAEAEEYATKLNAWIEELESYVGYINLVGGKRRPAPNESTDCNVILSGVSKFVVEVASLVGEAAEAMTTKITGLVKASAAYVTQNGSAANASFTIETIDTSGAMNPLQSIFYASTCMSKTQNGKSVAESSLINLTAITYKLNSSAIVAMAEHFAASSTIQGARQYCDYMNGPVNNFRKSC